MQPWNCTISHRLGQDSVHRLRSPILDLQVHCTLPLHSTSVCIVRTVRYLSSQDDSEAVRYTIEYASRSRILWREFRGSGRSCSRSAAGISACSRPARQCPDRPVTPRSNPGMHAVSENSEKIQNSEVPRLHPCEISQNSSTLNLRYRLIGWRYYRMWRRRPPAAA